MRTLAQFITQNAITSEAAYLGNVEESGVYFDVWRVEFAMADRSMTVEEFRVGAAHNQKEPTTADVLSCLISDSAGVDSARSFEDWADEYGYDTDSRKAEGIFNACLAQREALAEFLGDTYGVALWETESL